MMADFSDQSPPKRGRTVAIASGKGGTGKTFFAITLAAIFSRLGRKTLLVDGDLSLANVDVHLGIAPNTDLAAVLAGWVGLEDAVTPVDGGSARGGFDVLPGRSGSGALAEVSSEEVARLAAGLKSLSDSYDEVVVDLGAGIDACTMRLARGCDRVVMVLTDEPSSMTDTYAFIKVLKGYAPDVEQFILVNQAETRWGAETTYNAVARACQTFLGFRPKLLGSLLWDWAVRKAAKEQQPIATTKPESEIVSDVFSMAKSLVHGFSHLEDRGITEEDADEISGSLESDDDLRDDVITDLVNSLVSVSTEAKKKAAN